MYTEKLSFKWQKKTWILYKSSKNDQHKSTTGKMSENSNFILIKTFQKLIFQSNVRD